MHLYIEQRKDNEYTDVETVGTSVIKKLYELVSGGLDQTSYLKGRIKTTVASLREINEIMSRFPDLTITADEYALSFDDPEVESICISNWGSNGVVTASQLAAVTAPGWSTFKNNTNIVSGDDFIYFSGLTGKGTSFDLSGCSNMTSLTIPPHITEMFSVVGCSSLTTITGLDHIQKVDNAFTNCTSLQSLTFTNLTGVCKLGEGLSGLSSLSVNEGCTELRMTGNNSVMTSLSVPASVTRCDIIRFSGITTITFAPNSQLTSTSDWAGFTGCSNLTTLVNFPWDSWTSMGSYCFNQCYALRGTIKTPIGQTTIPASAFSDVRSIDTIIIDAAVTTIGSYNFDRCNSNGKVIMNPTTPPTLSHSVQGANYGQPKTTGIVFYVPDASYNDYIANAGQYWTELYDNGRLKKMSELPS